MPRNVKYVTDLFISNIGQAEQGEKILRRYPVTPQTPMTYASWAFTQKQMDNGLGNFSQTTSPNSIANRVALSKALTSQLFVSQVGGVGVGNYRSGQYQMQASPSGTLLSKVVQKIKAQNG